MSLFYSDLKIIMMCKPQTITNLKIKVINDVRDKYSFSIFSLLFIASYTTINDENKSAISLYIHC